MAYRSGLHWKRSIFGQSGSALTRVVQAATQSETTQGQIDAANKKREQLEKERTELKETLSSSESKKGNILQYISTLDKRWTR